MAQLVKNLPALQDCVSATSLQLCLTLCNPMDVAHQAPLSMGFSRQEYWSGLLCPPPGSMSLKPL